jgi:CO/xanthine dehydrogenase Mo-binding subunit
MNAVTRVPRRVEEMLDEASAPSRRAFLKTSGLFVVSVAALAGPLGSVAGAQATGAFPDPDYLQLDAWIVIHADGTATFYVGKTDLGQGTGTAFRQLMADELDIAYDRTSIIMGRTDLTVDQGGSGGSDAIERDGWPMRRVAAEARRLLLGMGAERLGVPMAQLTVRDGVIGVAADPARQVTYGDLVGGRRFNYTLIGANVDGVTGLATVKAVQDLRIVGQSIPRFDIPAKVDGSLEWAVDVRLPGMVHARNVKPPVAGAQAARVNEASVRDLPGFVRVVREGNYVAVVCEREEQAIAAARRLEVEWTPPATAPFPASEDLFDYMRAVQPRSTRTIAEAGDFDTAIGAAARVVEAEYEFPFQGHTAIGPAHATADPSDGMMTIYSNDMKSYGLRNGVAEFLGLPREQVRVIWMDGPQAFGRTAADDAGFEAAFLANELGRPVRLQWMRDEETAWDTKGPAYLVRMRAGFDALGALSALEYDGRAAVYNHLGYNEHDSVLIAQLTGRRRLVAAPGRTDGPDDMYEVPHRRATGHVVSLPLVWETPLRTGNLRDPNGPQITFASESFIDELAADEGSDPVAFRLRLLRAGAGDDDGFRRARSIATIEAAVAAYNWDTRPSPRRVGTEAVLTGRGIAYTFRGQTIAVEIAEVEVTRETGHVWVKRLVAAHDCGLVVNPEAMRRTVECGTLHSVSRALHEEVRFDTEKVTSIDWVSHPSLRHMDTPERIDVVIVNGDPNPDRPDLPHYGAGEAVCKPTVAAIANAIHDATGVRIRRAPFRDDRVLAALRAAGV